MTRLVGLLRSPGTAVVAALLAPLGVAALLVPFRSSFPNTDAALVLVVVVVAVAAFGRRIAGLIAAASAAAWFDFFLTRPYEHFTITHRADVETTVLLLVVGAAVTEIAARARVNRVRAATDEAYLDAIRMTNEAIAAGDSAADLTEDVRITLIELLHLRDCAFERYSFGGMPRLQADGTLQWGGQSWDVERRGLPNRPVELIATADGRAYGRFVLTARPDFVPTQAARQVAAILAAQVGLALAASRTGLLRPGQSVRAVNT